MSSSHQSSFINDYVFSTDHKYIAKQYLLTGLFMALVGGYLSYVFRMQLAYPGSKIPGFGTIEDGGVYNALVTMHGTIMVFWVAMPILLGAFGNFLIPLMIGAKDMAFPKLNMMSYWIFFLSTVVLLLSFIVPGGAASSGWTAYPPLSARTVYTDVNHGMNLWILAVALEFISVLMGGINYLTTVINLRAKGMSFFRLPMMVWMQLVATIIFMLSVGPLIAGAFMMLFDRLFETGFYLPGQGGDPLLWQHLFWFFGHPEVYVILLPTLGIVAEVLPAFSRKPLFGYKMIIYSTLVAGVLSFVVWAHHQFVSGMDPRLAMPFALMTILISVPFAIVMFSYIATLWKGNHRISTAFLFAIGMIAEFLIGGVTGIINGASATDIYVHDTYYVVAHFHYTLVPITIFGMMAGIYYWFPKMYGRMMNEKLGYLHFIVTTVMFNCIFIPLFQMGMAGHHRRIVDPSAFSFLEKIMPLHKFSTISLIILIVGQLPFIFNFFFSMFKGKRASDNPWEVTTLEWQCSSPPLPHKNFAHNIKVVHGPYEYSRPDEQQDWTAQGIKI